MIKAVFNQSYPDRASADSLLLDPDEFEAARQARDPRFDGRFFVGVLTTGIYCRPVCPVRVPKKQNVQLYRSAAAAAAAGFRPCLRCRPETAPGTPAWTGASWKVSRALQLIEQGALDGGSVGELARRLDIGPRQLSRLFQNTLGASPIEVAQTRRLHFAKQLIDETSMALTEVCFAAGFGSVRRFNSVFQQTYGRSPRQLRERANRRQEPEQGVELTLAYRPPFDWRAMLEFLAYRSIPGVEVVAADSYVRSFELDGEPGYFIARFLPQANRLHLTVHTAQTRHLYQIVERVRALFDLRADSDSIDGFLEQDHLLEPLTRRLPGLRVPGCWDGFEVAVRAVLGQQVSVKAASTLVARIAHRHGQALQSPVAGLTHRFPSAATLVRADLDGLGIVGKRIEAIKAIAAALEQGRLSLDGSMPSNMCEQALCELPGVGPWTAQYIALRALGDPNAFPFADLILRRAAAPAGQTLTTRAMQERAESWQPWRAYAVMLLWRGYQLRLTDNHPGDKQT